MQLSKKQKAVIGNALLILVLVLVAAAPAFAGTTGGGANPFSSVVQMVVSWLKGGLGLLLALLALAVGLVAGVARGSIGGVLGGVGVAIAAYWGPDVLEGIFGATAHAAVSVFRTIHGV